MIYLVVGVDATTLAPWHENVMARDAMGAARVGLTRAAECGLELVVAAVIDAHSSVADGPWTDRRASAAVAREPARVA